MIQQLKQKLRRETQDRLAGMTDGQRSVASSQACLLLGQQQIWKEARSILFYAPMPGEPDVWPLVADSLAAGKLVALPRFDATTGNYAACQLQDSVRDIVKGRFGIREPAEACGVAPLDRLDLVLVPGVAFDLRGRRLGRGKGFYDRLLPLVRGITCAVAFDEQIVAEIPVEPHDVVLNWILTPTRWIEAVKRD